MTILLVTDLKQYMYCPRLVYYTYCLPDIRPTTARMEAGREAHEAEEGRELRRSLRTYGLKQGVREFDVWLESADLGLRGKVDMTICVADPPEAIAVEYKDSSRPDARHPPGAHWVTQLVAYSILLAEHTGLPTQRGFFYYIPLRRSQEVALTDAHRNHLRQTVTAVQEMIVSERMPDPPVSRQPCLTCEFRRFCNDV